MVVVMWSSLKRFIIIIEEYNTTEYMTMQNLLKNAEQYFDANYDLLLREDLVDTLKEQIANMDDMDDITTLVKKYDEHEDGYYCDGIDGEQKMTLSRLGELTYYNGEKKSIWFGIRF